MSNFSKRDLPFCGSDLNQSLTVVVFRHWLTMMVFATFMIIFSRSFLLVSPNSLFEGLSSRHLVLFWMFGLWSLTVIKTGRLELHFLFSLGLSDSAIFSVYLSILCLKSDSHLPNFFLFICFNDSPWKMTKNVFYFILKALFVLKIFKFLPWLFGHVEETAWLERCG